MPKRGFMQVLEGCLSLRLRLRLSLRLSLFGPVRCPGFRYGPAVHGLRFFDLDNLNLHERDQGRS